MIGAAGYRSRDAALLVAAAAAAWAVLLIQSRSAMGGMAADLPAFATGWTVMMAAMMLPSVAPVAALYSRAAGRDRRRMLLFTAGYLGCWAATAIPAFLVAGAGSAVAARYGAARPLAAGAFLLVAAYQLTPAKTACLDHCRSPLSLLLRYAGLQGPLRDLRAGAEHGLRCLGCCWALMLLLPVLGMLNLVAVALVAIFAVAEKNLLRGPGGSRLAAAAALALAVAALFVPALSAGLA